MTVTNPPLPAEGDEGAAPVGHTVWCPSLLFDPAVPILSGSGLQISIKITDPVSWDMSWNKRFPRLLRKLSAWITENGFCVGFQSAHSKKNLFLDSVYLAELAPRKKNGLIEQKRYNERGLLTRQL